MYFRELLTRIKVRNTFSLLDFVHEANSYTRLSRTLESITAAELAGINFHNIWQVDTPRERTDPASGNDHSRLAFSTPSCAINVAARLLLRNNYYLFLSNKTLEKRNIILSNIILCQYAKYADK